MRKFYGGIKCLIVIITMVCFIGVMPAISSAAEPVQLKLASTRVGSGWYVMAGIMADVIGKGLPAGSTVAALPKSGAVGNPKVLNAKKVELAFTFPMVANWAWNGKIKYTEKLTNIRALLGDLGPYWVAGGVKTNIDIKSWADVKAKKMKIRISTQTKGGLSDVGARHVLGEYGITPEDLKSWGGDFMMKGFNEMIPGLKAGQIDGFLMMCTPNHPTWTEAAITRPMKFINLEDDVMSRLNSKYGYTKSILPAGMFQGQKEDIHTIGFPTVMLIHKDMPDDVAYIVVKSIVENKDKITAAYKGFESFDVKKGSKLANVGGVPFHPGAVKYFKEKGLM